jgi:hypothetical protein
MKATHSFFRIVPSCLLFTLLAALLLAAPLTARADDTQADGTETSASLEVGGRYADTDGDRTFIRPYDPMDSNAIIDFDFLKLNPGGRSFEFEGSFRDDQDWSAGAEYSHGADFSIGIRAQEFFHIQDHKEYAPDFETPAPGFGSVHVVGSDADPGKEYYSDFSEFTGEFKVRVPSYPAHVRGDARLYKKEGPNQLRYFSRNCATHICHSNSRTRDIDQETQEYNIGFDAHVGFVDVVYNRNFLSFEDKADDPMDFFGPFFLGRARPGMYPHHVNPESESYYDEIKLNTNLTNKAVLGLHYIGGESKNNDSDITEDNQRFVANLSYTPGSRHFFSARYIYANLETVDVSAEVAAAREAIGDAVEPGTKENAGEVTYRYHVGPGSDVHAHVRYTDIDRTETDASGLPENTTITTADIDGKFRVSRQLALEAELAKDWISDPAFATDFTSKWRYTLGATWSPAGAFNLLARYTGFTGENDDDAALQRAYYEPPTPLTDLKRESDGHNLLAVATWMPAETLTCVLSYNYSLNDIQQDMLVGTANSPTLTFLDEGSPFESMYQIAHLNFIWAATKQLNLTLGGMVIAGEETWDPESTADPSLAMGLSDAAHREFTKYMVDAEADFSLSDSLGLTLGAFYADYDDKVNDRGDGSGVGALATVTKKW